MTFISIICTALMCMFSHAVWVLHRLHFFFYSTALIKIHWKHFLMVHHISKLRKVSGTGTSKVYPFIVGLIRQEATTSVWHFYFSLGQRALSTCFYVTDNTLAPPTDVGQSFRSPCSRNATANRRRNEIDFVIPTPFKEHSRIMVAV